VTVRGVCAKVGMSRQNYYAQRRTRQRRQVDGDLVEAMVQEERRDQPRLGVRKLYHVIKPELEKAGVKLGRDRLFEELGRRGLLVAPKPAAWPRTTRVSKCLPVFGNRLKGLEVKRPNQVWVSDLTYLRSREGFLYLSLITDHKSRKIVGYHVSENLETEGCLKALEMALESLPPGARPTHHSDRGCQYGSHEYVTRLQERGLEISMTEEDHCAENALAERMNGILKQEYGLGEEWTTKQEVRQLVKQAVWLYNNKRPHTALGYECPERIHSLAA